MESIRFSRETGHRGGAEACSGSRPGPFRRCVTASRRPLALAMLLCAVPGAAVLPATAVAQSVAAVVTEAKEVTEAPVQRTESVDINTASAEELAAGLSGVGASKAEAIVRYREQFGPFASIDELSEVAGIGMATVERNRALMRLR